MREAQALIGDVHSPIREWTRQGGPQGRIVHFDSAVVGRQCLPCHPGWFEPRVFGYAARLAVRKAQNVCVI